MTTPSQTAENGRDAAGRFTQGNQGGPGRPRGLDFRAAVEERAARDGVSLSDAMWRVYQALQQRAEAGDPTAAKLLLDRLCGPQRAVPDTSLTPPVIRIITGVPDAEALSG